MANEDECLNLCKDDSSCAWFTYFRAPSECVLYFDCPMIDETCEDCFSGERSCIVDLKPPPTGTLACIKLKKVGNKYKKAKKQKKERKKNWKLKKGQEGIVNTKNLNFQGLSKLLVATGLTNGSFLSNIEIIDLSASASICNDLPDFPFKMTYARGGLFDKKTPVICGGLDEQRVLKSLTSFYDNCNKKLDHFICKKFYTVAFKQYSFFVTVAFKKSKPRQVSHIECFSYASNAWNQIQSMTVPRHGSAATGYPKAG